MSLLQAPLVVNPGDASGGGEIMIVTGDSLAAESSPLGTSADVIIPTNDQISVYVVREGDSLSQIAEMFNVSANTIRWANDINTGGTIREGQVLVILPISGVKYIVKKGDTLATIAKDFKGDLTEISQFNGLATGADLVVGTEIIIPHGETVLASSSSGSTGTTKTTKETSGNDRPSPAEGYFIRPISGGIRTQGVHGYNGVDLASYYGAEVYAAASGTVIVSRASGWNGGYGSYIVVRHSNGTQTLYAHLSGNLVSQGQNVVQGQVIGNMGSSGRSTGTHLHFEVRGATNPF